MKCYQKHFQSSCWWIVVVVVILFAGSVIAQEADTTASGTSSVQPVAEDASKNEETTTGAKMDNKDKENTATTSSVIGETTKEDAVVEAMKTAVLRVTVTQIGGDNQPIKDARVIVTYDNAKEFEHKTDEQGVALLTGLPYGKVDVDVTSSGRQSDGGTVMLDGPEKTLTFQLKPRGMDDNQE